MCGIAGMIDFNEPVEEYRDALADMLGTLRRRGPDQSGIFIHQNAALLHARLAVIDLENGRQPMSCTYGERSYTLIYNGELYNTEDIRRHLLAAGFTFTGHSDTEVLLKAYVHWGEDCLQHFNGIYAFAIWESRDKRLFIARDRMGVKPFFYYVKDGMFLFGSELKTLLRHPLVKAEIDRESLAELLLIGPGRTPGYGVFRGVQELEAGWSGYFSRDGLKTAPYWKMTARTHSDDLEQTTQTVRSLVEDAIRRQLVSDVPICTFLSGGLDSSIITAIGSAYMKERGEVLQTFSVDYQDNEKYFQSSKFQPSDDREYIKKVCDFLGCQHTTITVDTDTLVESLYDAVEARDLPGMADVDSSLLLFCREVKKTHTVALSGECADEIFGGYPWYRDEKIRGIDGFPWSQSTAYRAGFLKDEILGGIEPRKYVYDKYRKSIQAAPVLESDSPLERRMKEMMSLNLNWFMQTLLDRKDRMSMYNGLEVRVPFCDHRITEYLYNVPWEYKNHLDREKGLLRRAVEGLLPQEVLWRKKSPYPKTHNPAYLAGVSRRLREIIESPSAPLLDFIKKQELENLLRADNPQPWYGQLMTTPQTIAYFIQLNHWLEHYRVRII